MIDLARIEDKRLNKMINKNALASNSQRTDTTQRIEKYSNTGYDLGDECLLSITERKKEANIYPGILNQI